MGLLYKSQVGAVDFTAERAFGEVEDIASSDRECRKERKCCGRGESHDGRVTTSRVGRLQSNIYGGGIVDVERASDESRLSAFLLPA